ncbi:wall-associated receptor kinase-like 1 [Pyrus x bretschneideri]|uniref:wall-associated receptor kinase-like 1 n=1 Tax=Pyrus x bretschneideri TaxID=225117 RepID=UPI00202E7E1E|nr:wall-associated receptor kinase-like 1 [Pyrus x bretschneideri]
MVKFCFLRELQQYYSLQHGPYAEKGLMRVFSTKRRYLFLQQVSYLTTIPTVVNCCYPFFYWTTALDDLLSEESGSLKISSKEIYSATGNPSADNFIDQGGAGKVYKGILSNGKHVAVKHIINDGSVETFISEVMSLSDVRHPDLVALLGSCEGVEEYFLVYELSQNGDLLEWLFGKDKSLPWITRLELAIDSAGGLWLLQTYPRGCIVHRDIKVALNFLHFFCLHRCCCFICHSFHQTSFLATFPTGSQQTFSLTKIFKRNCQTSSYLKLWTWDSPM